MIARKHFIEPEDRKRTSLYELVDNAGTWSVVDHGDFPSAGDTSYAGVVPIAGTDQEFLVSYYSSDTAEDGPWARAILEASNIWLATIDLSQI